MKTFNSLALVALVALIAMPNLQASEEEHMQEQQDDEIISNTKIVGMSVAGSMIGCLAGRVCLAIFKKDKSNFEGACVVIGAIAGAMRAYKQEKYRLYKIVTPSTADMILETTTDGVINTTTLAAAMLYLGTFIYSDHNTIRALGAIGGIIGLGITYAGVSNRLEQLQKKRNFKR